MKRKRVSLLLIPLLWIVLGAFPLLAAGNGVIQGQLVNVTPGGDPIQGSEITLLAFQGAEQQLSRTTTADSQGGLSFEGLETGMDWAYRLRVTHGGVVYSGEMLSFAPDQDRIEAELRVYEPTTDSANVVVQRAHLLLSYTDTSLRVTEIHIYDNAGDRTYVGKEELDGRRFTARFVLPRGASNLVLEDGTLGGRFLPTPDGFVDVEPRWPGSTSVVFGYELPCPNQTCAFTKQVMDHTEHLNVLLPNIGVRLESDRLGFQGEVEAQGRSFLNYAARNLDANESLDLRLVASTARGQGPSLLSGWVATLAIAAGGAAIIVALAYPWLRRRPGNTATGPDPAETAAKDGDT